jgi:hypothetical protein
MSEAEQAAIYIRLKRESAEMQNEMAVLDAEIKHAAEMFEAVARTIKTRPAIKQDWAGIQKLTSEMSVKIDRYLGLELQKIDRDAQIAKFTEAFSR